MNTLTEVKVKEATKRQGWAIYTHLGYDIRSAELTQDQASKVIELSMAGRKKDALHLLDTLGAEKKKDIKPAADKKARNI